MTRRLMRRVAAALVVVGLLACAHAAPAQTIGLSVSGVLKQVYVGGREVRFDRLGQTQGEPVVALDDRGLAGMLEIVNARAQWQPGTRFVVFTRTDGKLVTFTVGSNAVAVDDAQQALPVGPFYEKNRLYVPLLGLARALELTVHQFSGGYAFAPKILSVQRLVGQRRTVVEVRASAPLYWRATYDGAPHHPTLVISFPGFANGAGTRLSLGGREGASAFIAQRGPPGYPITSIAIDVMHGVKFASHRAAGGGTMDLILARAEKDLAIGAVVAVPSSLAVTARPSEAPPSTPTSSPPSAPADSETPVAVSSGPVPTAQPAPEYTDNATGPGAQASSPAPLASGAAPQLLPLEKITDAFVTNAAGASRITLSLTGPVTFEWHRLADPDNRFWVDISQAQLVGPARDLSVQLPFIRSVKVSQHQLDPDHVVRVSIDPSRPVDIAIGAIEGSPDQLGIEIRSAPPPPDAAASGVGSLPGMTRPSGVVPKVTRGPTQPKLIVIDPGHGGNDPGSLNTSMGLVESHLTLAISQRLRAALQRAGWQVTMTREADNEVGDPGGKDAQELQARCDVANASDARFFISVHVNSSVSSGPSGLTTYFWHPEDRGLAQAVHNAVLQSAGIGNVGVRRENFYVTRHAFMPSLLIEVAYLSNPHDAALLQQPSFLQKIADGIAQGVKNFTGGPPSS